MEVDYRVRRTGAHLRWVGWLMWLGAWIAAGERARAHDLWLEPSAALVSRGDELVLHLQFGDAFKSEDERPLQKDHISRFDLFSDRARRRNLLLDEPDDQTPVAKVRLESGAGLVVMDRPARPITMPADKFNRYLADEGLDAITALRARLGQTDQPGRETYSRYLKVLLQERDLTAATPSTLYKRRTGQRLEVLLETDPGRMKPGGMLSVKVLFDDKPLPDARVFAYHRSGSDAASDAVTAVTSARGLAEFKVDQPGLWLIRTVHMQAAAASAHNASAQPGWESFWAAYVFAVREAPPAPPVTAVPSPTREGEHETDVHH